MKLNITPTLLTKLNILSSEYSIEVGGYLTGKIVNGEIFLKDLLIPEQQISIGSIEITPKNQINLLKKFGQKKVKQIVGHWHSHHNMGCFWSGQDITNMNNIMEYKDLFVFIVSSNKNHLIKVCLNNPLKIEIDENEFYIKSLNTDLMRKKVNNIINNKSITTYSTNWFNNIELDEEKRKKLEEINDENNNEKLEDISNEEDSDEDDSWRRTYYE